MNVGASVWVIYRLQGEKWVIKKKENCTNELLNSRCQVVGLCDGVMENAVVCFSGNSVVLCIPCSTGIDYSQSLCRNYNKPENCVGWNKLNPTKLLES